MTTTRRAAVLAGALLALLAAAGAVGVRFFTAGENSPRPRRAPNQWNSPAPRYLKGNRALGKPAAATPRVVFLGDSVVERWTLADYFSGTTLEPVNRGISGQTTRQMLLRFHQDAASLAPRVVVLIGGANDPASGVAAERTAKNLETMARLAREAGAVAVVGTVWSPRAAETRRVNDAVKEFCGQGGCTVADFDAALCPGNACDTWLLQDGLHPTPAGYRAMRRVLQAAIAKAVR